MDSLTHLVAGALTPLVFRNTPKRAAVLGFGIAIGELPDIDILFGTGPEALLALHRGISHALLVQPLLVLPVVLLFFLWMRRRNAPLLPLAAEAGPPLSSGGLSPALMYGMALIGVYTHIYLDCMTTFGTQIFLPFSRLRVGFPAMFIVDLLLTIPALVLMIMAWRQKPDIRPLAGAGEAYGAAVVSGKATRLARIGLVWILLYPLAALAINGLATGCLGRDLPSGHKLALLTEPFSPLIWKAVVDEGGHYSMSTVNLLNPVRPGGTERYAKPDPELYARLKGQIPLFAMFEDFCSFMVQTERPAPALAQAGLQPRAKEYSFVDMRYLMSPHSAARHIGRTDPNFVLEARVGSDGSLLAYRFLQRGKEIDKAWTVLP